MEPGTLMVRGVRGATTVPQDNPEEILEATRELLKEMLSQNGISDFEVISAILFSTTRDLTSTFPAEAARALGMTAVPLMCHSEIDVPGRTPRAIRVMIMFNTRKSQAEISHVYLRDAKALRPDLTSAQ